MFSIKIRNKNKNLVVLLHKLSKKKKIPVHAEEKINGKKSIKTDICPNLIALSRTRPNSIKRNFKMIYVNEHL